MDETKLKLDFGAEPRPSLWETLRRWFIGVRHQRQLRIDRLTESIEQYPDAAANYLLRGEIWLEQRHYELARADFEQALALAEAQFADAAWGIAAQAIMDRAREGLRQVEQRLDDI